MKTRLGEAVDAAPVAVIDEAARASFAQEGFLTIPRLLAPEAVAEVERLVAPLLEDPAPLADGLRFDYAAPEGTIGEAPRVLQLLLPFDYEPRLFDTAFFRRSASLARQLLGPALRYRGSHYVEKPPGVDNPTAMHQDEAFWEPAHRHEAIAVWLPLDDVGPDASPLEMVPGSHLDDALRPHRRIGGDPRVHGLELHPPLPDDVRRVACPLPRGGASVHHCRLVHGAGPNRGPRPRRALVLNLEAPPIALPTPREVPWQRTGPAALARRRAERDIELP